MSTMRSDNVEKALVDATNWNKRIDVDPADDGEELTDEVREITDDEAVEILESVSVSEEDRQLRLQVNQNAEKIQALGTDITKIRSRIYDDSGVPGFITQTNERLERICDDIHDGFSGQDRKWSDFEKILMDMVKEITKKTETNTDCIEDHERRLEALENRNRKEDAKKDETRSIVKRVLIGSALGNGGVLAGVWFWVNSKLHGG